MPEPMRPEDAETRVLEAALRALASGLGDMHADSDAEAEYASEQLALAARELTRATDASDRKPVGWGGGDQVTVSAEDVKAILLIVDLYVSPDYKPSIIVDRLAKAAGIEAAR